MADDGCVSKPNNPFARPRSRTDRFCSRTVAQLREENAALRAELDDFRQSSKELEEELERELERAGKDLETTKSKLDQARRETEDWKVDFLFGSHLDEQLLMRTCLVGLRTSSLPFNVPRRPRSPPSSPP